MLLSPQTIRSGFTPPSSPPPLSSRVSVSLASVRCTGSFTTPGCTMATVMDRAAGNGGVSANASGPAPATTTRAATPAAASAIRRELAAGAPEAPGVPGANAAGKAAPSAAVIATFAITRATLTSHTPPTAASASTAGCCHWDAPYSAQGPPSPW